MLELMVPRGSDPPGTPTTTLYQSPSRENGVWATPRAAHFSRYNSFGTTGGPFLVGMTYYLKYKTNRGGGGYNNKTHTTQQKTTILKQKIIIIIKT